VASRSYYTIRHVPIIGLTIVTRRASFDGLLTVDGRRFFWGDHGRREAIRYVYGRR